MIKVALLLCSAAVCTTKHRKNSKPELQNQFLFCNRFLLFVRYLHGGQEDFSNDQSGLNQEKFNIIKKRKEGNSVSVSRVLFLAPHY